MTKRRRMLVGKRQDLSGLSEAQRRLYDKMSKNVRRNWPITTPQFFDIIEQYEDTGETPREFKEVVMLVADKYLSTSKIEVYPSLK